MSESTSYEPPPTGTIWVKITSEMIRQAEEQAARERIRELVRP